MKNITSKILNEKNLKKCIIFCVLTRKKKLFVSWKCYFFKLSTTRGFQSAISSPFLQTETKQKMLWNACVNAESLIEKFLIFIYFLYFFKLKLYNDHHFESRRRIKTINELGRDFCKFCTLLLTSKRFINTSCITWQKSWLFLELWVIICGNMPKVSGKLQYIASYICNVSNLKVKHCIVLRTKACLKLKISRKIVSGQGFSDGQPFSRLITSKWIIGLSPSRRTDVTEFWIFYRIFFNRKFWVTGMFWLNKETILTKKYC